MELSSIVPAPPPPPLPPQLSPGYQPPVPPQIQPPAATPASTLPVPGGDQPIGLPRDTTVPLLPQPSQPTTPQLPAPQQTASIQTDLVRDPTGRNNPGNIRIPGATGPAGFQTYPTMQDGMRALQNNLLSYQDQRGLNTIEGIISTWAPPKENDTEALIKKAEASMGIDRHQRIDLHDPATMTRMTNVILAQEQDKAGGSGPNGMKLPQPQQHMLPPERRDSPDWGHPSPVSGDMPGATPQPSEFGRIMNYVAPALMALGSIALRLPLSTTVMAYSAMARAQANGQREAYERSRTQWQDKLAESNAQQALESKDASDAFDTYGQNNPQGLQQRLMQIALTYNDPILYATAAKGDLNGAHKLQADRDLHNQSLFKLNDAVRKQQEDQAQDAAVKALDQQWHDEFVKTNGREPTADETAIEHNKNIGEAARAGTKDPKGESSKEEAQPYDVVDKNTGEVTRQVRLGQNGGLNDLEGKPTKLAPNEKLGEKTGTKEGSQGSPAQHTEMDAAKADLADWVAKQPTPPTEDQKKQKLAEFLAQRHQEMQRQPVPKSPGDYDIIDPDKGNKVIDRGRNLVPIAGGGWFDQDTKKPWVPPEGSPNARPMKTTPSTTGGGRYGQYNLRVINSGKQVALHLQNAMLLSQGTTVGMFSGLSPGTDLTKATTAVLGRMITSEESKAMGIIMAGMQRELAQAEAFGLLPSNRAQDLQEALIPKPGMTLNDVLLAYATIRQDVDAIMDTVKLSPYATQEEKDDADKAKADMAKAVWWTPANAIQAMRSRNPGATYGDAARRMGLGNAPPAPGGGGWSITPVP